MSGTGFRPLYNLLNDGSVVSSTMHIHEEVNTNAALLRLADNVDIFGIVVVTELT